jgi:hypothetical protein
MSQPGPEPQGERKGLKPCASPCLYQLESNNPTAALACSGSKPDAE